MAYSSPSLLVRFRGTLINQNQSWSYGLRWVGTTPPTLANLQAIAAALVAGAPAQNMASLMSATTGIGCVATGVDVYYYPTYPGKASVSASADYSPFRGPSTGDNMPSQCSLVVSLRTAVTGRSGRGRVYLPFTRVAQLETSGQVGFSILPAVADAWKGFADSVVGALNGVLPGYQGPYVVSGTHGVANAVTQYVIDSKVDTQRRREDKLPANYTASRPAVG